MINKESYLTMHNTSRVQHEINLKKADEIMMVEFRPSSLQSTYHIIITSVLHFKEIVNNFYCKAMMC